MPAALLAAACGSQAESSLVAEGRERAERKACLSCHSADGEKKVGPTWKGLYGSPVELDDGTTVNANEAYLRESIADPDAKTVKGYERGVMSGVIKPGSVTAKDLDALIAYIKSLR